MKPCILAPMKQQNNIINRWFKRTLMKQKQKQKQKKVNRLNSYHKVGTETAFLRSVA